jgi:predicted nucleic acid-binding protein
MKPMKDKIFLDSNILVYCYSNSDVSKQTIARELATAAGVCISTQVLNETINVLYRKFSVNWSSLENLVTDFENNFFMHSLTAADVKQACRIASRYNFSFYDSMIISVALECSCSILYSEDLKHGQLIENRIKIVNPFL